MKKLFCAVVVIVTLASCGMGENTASTSDAMIATHVKIMNEAHTYARRVHVLENGTISYVNFTPDNQQVFTYGDSVWVNLATHQIDDTCSSAMMCVIGANLK